MFFPIKDLVLPVCVPLVVYCPLVATVGYCLRMLSRLPAAAPVTSGRKLVKNKLSSTGLSLLNGLKHFQIIYVIFYFLLSSGPAFISWSISHCRNISSYFHLERWICIQMLKNFPINICEYKQLSLENNDQSVKTETCDLVKSGFRFTNFYLWCAIKHLNRLICPKSDFRYRHVFSSCLGAVIWILQLLLVSTEEICSRGQTMMKPGVIIKHVMMGRKARMKRRLNCLNNLEVKTRQQESKSCWEQTSSVCVCLLSPHPQADFLSHKIILFLTPPAVNPHPSVPPLLLSPFQSSSTVPPSTRVSKSPASVSRCITDKESDTKLEISGRC